MKHLCLMLLVAFFVCLTAVPSGFCTDKLTPEEMQIGDKAVHYPCSLELFNAARKSGIQFQADTSNTDISTYTNEVKRSLNLGRLISQGAIAVMTRDAGTLYKLTDAIEGLGQTFAVSKIIKEKKTTIINLVQQNRWDEVDAQMMQLETKVKNEMTTFGDPETVILANAGGMVTGLYYASKAIVESGSINGSGVLRQPQLVESMLSDLKSLSDSYQTATVKNLINDLPKIAALVTINNGNTIAMDNIKQLETISGNLVSQIVK